VLRSMGLGAGPPPGWITDPDVLSQLLTQAGFSGVQVAADTHVFHRADLDAYWQSARGGGPRRDIDALNAEQAARVRAALAERLEQYRQADGYHVPATALIATASK